MRLVFTSTVCCLLVGTLGASSQDKAKPLPQAGYPGEWINVNERAHSLRASSSRTRTRLVDRGLA